MAFSKGHRFDAVVYHLSLVCGALSHSARLVMVKRLLTHGECTVKELSSGIPLSKPTLSQHLKVLRELDIVRFREEFPTVIYWLNAELELTHELIDRIVGMMDELRSIHATSSMEAMQISARRRANTGNLELDD